MDDWQIEEINYFKLAYCDLVEDLVRNKEEILQEAKEREVGFKSARKSLL